MSTIAIAPMRKGSAGVSTARAAGQDPRGEVLGLFEEHRSSLFRFCRFTLASDVDAEDAVQDAFLKLLLHLERGGDRSNLRAWLFAVAANLCRDRIRTRRRWIPWDSSFDRRTVPPSDEVPDRRAMADVIRILPPRDRLLVALRAQGLSYREIASASGIREQSVGRLLARAVSRWKHAVDAGQK